MSDGQIRDSFVSASTEHAHYRVRDGRLDYYGAWCAGSLDKSQWLQVDLGELKEVMAVSVQGRENDAWVTSFYVQFSTDNVTWYCYGDKKGSKILEGNQNGKTSMLNMFHPDPILTRFVRINPQTWNNSICLRTEVYGCPVSSNETYAVGIPTQGQCYQAVTTTAPPRVQTTIPPTTAMIEVEVTEIRPKLKSLAKTGEIMFIRLFPHKGTNLQYHWEFGNGQSQDTQRAAFFYAYNSPGFYHVSVTGYNSISEASYHTTIVIQDEIKGVVFKNKYLAFKSTATIPWEVQEGTNITFTVDFGDNSLPLIMKTAGSGSGHYSVYHNYSTTGRFVATVSASNRINPTPKKIELIVFVQDPISGLNLTVDLPHKVKSRAEQAFIAIGENVGARAHVDSGTNVTFQFMFGETSFNQSETSLTYAYQKAGKYSIRVDAFNYINLVSVAFNLPIAVQTDSPIRGLSVQHGVTTFGESTAFLMSMDEGTAFFCDWSFGDGHSTESDFSDLGTAIVHTYEDANAYNVTITCTNGHGVALLSTLAWVQIPIGRLEMTLLHTLATTNSEVSYNISLDSGSHVSYKIDFGDGNVVDLILPGTVVRGRSDLVRHNFTVPGTFGATVVAVNRLGSVQVVCNSSVVVQSPIQGLQLIVHSPVKFSDAGVTYKLKIPMETPRPTGVTCRWSFGDNSTLTRNFLVDQQNQQITAHSFIKPGHYSTSVECHNFVSGASLNASIIVHKLLKPVMKVKSNHSLFSGSPCFAVQESFVLSVTSQAFDSSYTWDAQGGNMTKISNTHVQLLFRMPGLYTVRVRVDNFFEQMEATLDIAIQSRINGVKFSAAPTTMLSHVTHFSIDASVRGTDACYVIDFGEGGRDVILGGKFCLAGSDSSKSSIVQNEDASMSYGHVYGHEGNFSAILHAHNQVSEVDKSVLLEIWKPVCKVEEVVLKDLFDWTTRATISFTRSKEKTFLGQFTYSCSIVEGIEFEWKIYKLTSGGEQQTNSPLSVRRDELTSMATLAPRILIYGKFRLTMLVKLTGTDIAAIYGSVNKEKSVVLEVTASDIVALIKGGASTQVGVEMNLELDGSSSLDPDVERSEADPSLKFAWYCRTESANDKYVGCYKTQTDPEVALSKEAIFKTNTDEFTEGKTYIYKLDITKDNRKDSAEQRVVVVKGAPPRMGISCKFNCKSKLVPSDRLALDAVCLSCRREIDLVHLWQVFEWTPSGLKSVADLDSHTTSGISEASLAINSDFFTAGKTYLVRLTANKPDGAPGTSERNFTVYLNTPPSSGRCSVEPSFGYARVTNFKVTCQGWKDPDVPLLYRFTSQSSGGGVTVISSGASDNARFIIPTATKGVNSTVKVIAWIEDSYGLGIENDLFISVTEASSGASANVSYSSLMNGISGLDDVDMENASESEQVMHLVQSVQLLSGFLNTAGGSGVLGQDEQNEGTESGAGKEAGSDAGKEAGSDAGKSTGSGVDKDEAGGTVTPGQVNQPGGQQGGQSGQGSGAGGGGGVMSAENGKEVIPTPSAETIQRAQVREGIISKVSNVVSMVASSNTTTINDIELVTSALKEVTKKPDEMTVDSVLLSVDSLVAVAGSLKQKSGSQASPGSLERVSESLLQSVWNVMESVNQPYMIPSSSTSNLTKEEEKEIVKKATSNMQRILQSVGDAVLASKLVGDPPSVIRVQGIVLTLERHDIRTIGNRTFRNQGGQFRLPRGEVLMERLTSVEDYIIDSQLVFFFQNPCKWCKNSDQVTSKIIGLDLKNSKGHILNVSNLREDIDIIVLRDRQQLLASGDFTFSLAEDGKLSQLHAFNTSMVGMSASAEFMTSNAQLSTDWVITLRKDEPPTENDYDLAWTLHSTRRRRRRDISNSSKPAQEKHEEVISEIFFIPTELLRSLVGMLYVKVSTNLRTNVYYKSSTGNSSNVTYHLNILTSSCYFWDEKNGEWKGSGCTVGPETNGTAVQCFCDHLTSFGNQQSSFAPNRVVEIKKPAAVEVGYLKLSKSSESSEKSIVLITVLVTLGIYIILLVWARNEDLNDARKAKVVHLENREPGGRYHYEVTVTTGSRRQAGTSSNLYCVVTGDRGETGTIALKDSQLQRFQKSGVDSFMFSSLVNLGNLKSINVWHDNSGRNPSWYLKEIVVRDLASNNVYYFPNDCWLAVEYEDGCVQRVLSPADSVDMKAFTKLFYRAARFTEFHLWISVFTRPAKSKFSRVERLTCCLTFLYCTMFLSAVYFDVYGETDSSSILVKVGPIPISIREIVIGIVSGVIILPLNLCIAQVFRSARPKEITKNISKHRSPTVTPAPVLERDSETPARYSVNYHEPEYNLSASMQSVHQPSTLDLNPPSRKASTVGASSTSLYSDCGSTSPLYKEQYSAREVWNASVISDETGEEGMEMGVDVSINENANKVEERKQLRLPHWCTYVTLIFSFSVSCTSAVFVILYGLQFGNDKAGQWVASILVSFLQDVILLQPLHVLLTALFYALIVKRPLDDSTCVECRSEKKSGHDPETVGSFRSPSNLSYRIFRNRTPLPTGPPSEEELSKARSNRIRDIQMKQILVDIVLYVLFLLSLCLASYSQRDPQAFYVARAMEDTFLGGAYTGYSLKESDSADSYWQWIQTTVIPSLNSTSRDWASGCSPRVGYIVDCDMRLVGAARVRQVRVAEGDCQVPSAMADAVKECSNFYSFFKEDEGNYSLKWQNTNISLPYPSPWQYQTSAQLGLYPYMGKFATYGGGGYVVDLRHTSETYDTVKQLQENGWLDLRTRAVFVDVAVYSAQVNLFGIATFLVEWLPTNGALFFNNVKVARLYADSALGMIMMVSQIFLALFVLFFIYSELKKIYKMRSKYLKDPWNCLELTQIALVFGCIGTLYKRSAYTASAVELMKVNPNLFVSLAQAATWDELFTYLLGLLVFFATLKLLKLIRFNHTVFLLTRTLAAAATPLVSFSIVFFVAFMAYSIVFYVLYGPRLQEYSNFITALESVFQILMGAFDFEAIVENNRELGPIIFVSFMLFMVMVLMNMFLTIIMDCFSEVQADEDLQTDEYNIVDFVKEHVVHLLWRRNTVEVGNEELEATEVDSGAEAWNRSSQAYLDIGEESFPCAHFKRRNSDGETSEIFCAKDEELQFLQPKRVAFEDSTASALIQFYDFLGKAVDAKQSNSERRVEFDLPRYRGQQPTSSNICASYLPLEPALDGVHKCFARVAIDDIDEDQIFEVLFRSYVARKYYVPFEEEDQTEAKRQEKIKWKYTRHMLQP